MCPLAGHGRRGAQPLSRPLALLVHTLILSRSVPPMSHLSGFSGS